MIKIEDIYDDNYFMKMALQEAHLAMEAGEIPVGAVVVCNNKIIAKGYNQTEKLCDVTAHAEMIALTAAANYLGSKYLMDCTMYITLEPCAMCTGALKWAQIGKIVFGAKDLKNGNTSDPKLSHPKTTIIGGVLEKESEQLLKEFFTSLR